jgi:hypothetical protein
MYQAMTHKQSAACFNFHVFVNKRRQAADLSDHRRRPIRYKKLISEMEYSNFTALSSFHHVNPSLEVVTIIAIRQAYSSVTLNSLSIPRETHD